MKRIFIQFYLVLMGCFLIGTLILGGIYKEIMHRSTARYIQGFFSTVLSLVEKDLRIRPFEEWEVMLRNYNLDSDIQLDIAPINRFTISAATYASLQRGEFVSLEGNKVYMQLIEQGPYVLVAGPIPDGHYYKQITLLDLLLVLGMAALMGVGVIIWLWPHWRDLSEIERSAKRIGAGDFEGQAKISERSSVYPVAKSFNQMASSVRDLLERQESLIGDIAHEVRTPLARMRYRLALINDAALEENFSRDIENINALIEELLFKAKVDTIQAEFSSFNASEWIEDRVNWVKPKCPESIQWYVYGQSVEIVSADRHQMTRALDNLLTNAIRYAQSRIEITLRKTEKEFLLSVADDGKGIPEDQRQHVLSPFVRLDQSRSRNTGGHGLGLAIVSSIAQSHGGKVLVGQSGYGGAIFSISWPIVDVDALVDSPAKS